MSFRHNVFCNRCSNPAGKSDLDSKMVGDKEVYSLYLTCESCETTWRDDISRCPDCRKHVDYTPPDVSQFVDTPTIVCDFCHTFWIALPDGTLEKFTAKKHSHLIRPFKCSGCERLWGIPKEDREIITDTCPKCHFENKVVKAHCRHCGNDAYSERGIIGNHGGQPPTEIFMCTSCDNYRDAPNPFEAEQEI